MGQVAGALERRMYVDSRMSGVAFTGLCVAGAAAVGVGAARLGTVGVGLTVYSALGGTTLCRVGDQMADALERNDIDAARALVPSLCGRDPDELDAAGIARATVESIAENTSDATVGPLVWSAVFGAPGAVVYRAINTLDAMVGYRTPRYRSFGWASARLDDLVNLVPARVAGIAVAASSGRAGSAIRIWARDAAGHPSPNAGVVEAAFAGALDLRLGGRTVYRNHVEDRPSLGDGRAPEVADIRRAVRLSRRVQAVSAGVAVVAAWALRRMVD